MSGVVCIKCSLSKSIAVLEYEFIKLLEKGENELSCAWKAKMYHSPRKKILQLKSLNRGLLNSEY